jgi:hypothetical protein
VTPFDRRRALAAGLAAGAATGIAPARAARFDFDLTKTVDVYRAYTRMRGGGDGVMGLWWYTGNVWMQTPDKLAKLALNIDGFSFQKLTMQPDGSMVQLMSEAGYFKDPATGAIADTWVNPFNGETCRPRHYKSMQTIVATPDGGLKGEEDGRMSQREFEGAIGPAAVNGDGVWIPENFATKFMIPQRPNVDPLEDVGEWLNAASLATFAARLSDVQNRDLAFVPCTLNFQTMNGWLPWMRMGRAPGWQSWQLYGHKVAGIDALPPALRARFEKDYPGWLANPGI